MLFGGSYRIWQAAEGAESSPGGSSGLPGAPRWLYTMYGRCCNSTQTIYWFVLQ